MSQLIIPMSQKETKKRGLINPNEPATKLELHQELEVTKQELRKEISEVKQELKKEISEVKQELISAMCEQTQKVIDHFDNMFKENKKEHFEMRRDIHRIKNEIGI
jgi:hypothetical protein